MWQCEPASNGVSRLVDAVLVGGRCVVRRRLGVGGVCVGVTAGGGVDRVGLVEASKAVLGRLLVLLVADAYVLPTTPARPPSLAVVRRRRVGVVPSCRSNAA